MNTPPVFNLCNACQQVSGLLRSGDTLRVYEWGKVPQNTAAPYAVWQELNGGHEPSLNERPCNETHLVQIDCYAKCADEAKQVRNAIEYALEIHALSVAYRGNILDDETKLYRAVLEINFITTRPTQ